MTYAPQDLMDVRRYLLTELDIHPGNVASDLDPDEVGIVGDPAHASTGGYHEGNNDLARVGRLTSDYSKRESPRDRPGSNAASALDIGQFNRNGLTLPKLSAALVQACREGDPRTHDIREIIYSLDGVTVRRYDALGIRSTGDPSHLYHTHLSFFRDSEGRRNRPDNVKGLLTQIIEGSTQSNSTPGGGKLSFLVSFSGTVYMCGDYRRPAPDFPTVQKWQSMGLPQVTVASVQELEFVAGPLAPNAISPVVNVTDAQLDDWAGKVAQRVIAADDNELTQSDFDRIRTEIVEGAKQAAREGTK